MEQEKDLNELLLVRRRKLEELKNKGIEPFGYKFEADHYSTEIIENYDSLEGETVTVAGRLTSIRSHGKPLLPICRTTGATSKFIYA